MTLDQAIEQACQDVGIYPPKKTGFGKWLNTDTIAGKKGKGDGRVIINEHYVTAWNWQTGEKSTVALRDGVSAKEQRAIARDVSKAKAKAAQDAARAAHQADCLLGQARITTHPYLVDKGFRDEPVPVIPAQSVRQIAGTTNRRGEFIPADYLVAGSTAIIVPARRASAVTSLQLIWEDGTKKFLFGGEISGASHRIATGAYTWLCEGFATGLSLRAALRGLKIQATVLCCFSASNIVAVARQVKGRAFVAADSLRKTDARAAALPQEASGYEAPRMTESKPKTGIRVDGGRRIDMNKERVSERMAGVVVPPRTAEQVRASATARRKADDKSRQITARLKRLDGGKEGAILAKSKVTISHDRSSYHTIRCRPGTFEWRYGRGKPSALFHAGNHFAILWERAGVSVASSADFLRGTKSGYSTGISDGRVAAIDALHGLIDKVGHFSFERLMLYCVQGATSDEIAVREMQDKRSIATVLANDLRQCAIHFKYLGSNRPRIRSGSEMI